MAIITRWFGTAAVGAGDGTTWNDRAQLSNFALWSSVITAFDFTSDSLLCLIGPGTHSPTATFQTSLYSVVAPNGNNKCIWQGCDSSGVAIVPANLAWTADMPDFDYSGFPRIDTTTNIATITSGIGVARCLNFTASGRTAGSVLSQSTLSTDWVRCLNSASNTAAMASAQQRSDNCIYECSGTAFAQVIGGNPTQQYDNVRVKCNAAASSGNRRGVVIATGSASNMSLRRCFVSGGQVNVYCDSSTVNTSNIMNIKKCVIVGAVLDGILNEDSTSAGGTTVEDTVIANCGQYGINLNSGLCNGIFNCRLRDNTSSNIGNAGNSYTADLYTTDSDDASEFNDSASGDYRIKSGLAWSDRGIGVSQMPAAAAAATGQNVRQVCIVNQVTSPRIGPPWVTKPQMGQPRR